MRIYWPIYLIAASIGFLAPEIYAMVTHGMTLSNYSWGRLEVVQNQHFWQHNAAWALTLGAWIVIALWLTGHIWFRIFR